MLFVVFTFCSFAQNQATLGVMGAGDVCTSQPNCNLICNSSFEFRDMSQPCASIISSSFGVASLNLCNRWYPGLVSPDYLLRCSNTGSITWFAGTQTPRTGNAFADLTTYHSQENLLPNFSEYVAQNLEAPLIAGRKYYCSFYTNLTTTSAFSTSNLGMAVVPLSTQPATTLIPKIIKTDAITNTTSWSELIRGTFTANGTEQKVLIGRFGDSKPSPASGFSNLGYQFCNYAIDDVSLILLPKDLSPSICSIPTVIGENDCSALPSNMTISWTANGVAIAGANTSSISVSPLSLTTYTRIITIDGQQVSTSSCLVSPTSTLPTPSIVGNSDICANSSINLNILNPIANITYLWTNNQVGNSITVNTPGSYTVRAIAGNCTSSVSTPVNINLIQPPIITGNNSFCIGGSTILSVSNPIANITYLWSNNQIGSSITVNTLGSYSVRAVSNLCISQVSNIITITGATIKSPAKPKIMGDTLICKGQNTILSISNVEPNTIYFWSNGVIGNSISTNVSGSLSVVAISNSCTSVPSLIYIKIKTTPLFIDADTAVCSGTTISLPRAPTGTSTWTTLAPLLAPDILMNNQLTLFNTDKTPRTVKYITKVEDYNCTAYDTNTVTVYSISIDNQGNIQCANIVVPNVVTPNSDGKNETFKVKGIELFDSNKLIIYNRWGLKVYEKNNYANSWDGKSVPSGTYFYYLELTSGNYKKAYKGWVDILE